MGYADHLRDVGTIPNHPTCWGNPRSYDANDMECSQCKFRHSCRSAIDRGATASVPISRPAPAASSTYTSPYYRRREPADIDSGNYDAGIVEHGERAIERFAKDAVAGALRGMFHEMWQFWRNYRIP